MRVSKRPLPGAKIHLCGGLKNGGFEATLLGRWPDENGPLFHLSFKGINGASPYDLLEQFGHLPLPPYIERQQNAEHDPDEKKAASAIKPCLQPTPVR